MKPIRRISKWVVALAMTSAIGILPSCASMGGGGMHYDLLPTTSTVGEVISI
jgi:hypothetical protein